MTIGRRVPDCTAPAVIAVIDHALAHLRVDPGAGRPNTIKGDVSPEEIERLRKEARDLRDAVSSGEARARDAAAARQCDEARAAAAKELAGRLEREAAAARDAAAAGLSAATRAAEDVKREIALRDAAIEARTRTEAAVADQRRALARLEAAVAAETKSLVRSAAPPPPPPVVVEPKPPEVPEGSLADEVHRLAAKLVAVTRGPLEERNASR